MKNNSQKVKVHAYELPVLYSQWNTFKGTIYRIPG